jgi:hypothetical protein
MGNVVETLRRRVANQTAVPAGLLCGTCGYMMLTDEALAWMADVMPQNLSPPLREGGPATLSVGVRCRCEVSMEVHRREYESDRVKRFYASGVPVRRVNGPKTLAGWVAVTGAEKAYVRVTAWAAGNGAPILVMMGPMGTGKSHLCEAAARDVLNRDEAVLYTVAGDMMDDLRLRFNRPQPDGRIFEEQLEYLGTVDNLIIDDLGQKSVSIWALGQIVSIIDRRYRDERRTLIATNKVVPEGIESWARAGAAAYEHTEAVESAARLSSRLFDGTSGVVERAYINAEDYRARRSF